MMKTLNIGLLTVALIASLAGCAASPPPPPSSPPPVQALPFDAAVQKAANDLFSKAPLPAADTGEAARQALVIDPLVDGVSGAQSVATQSMGSRIAELVKTKYPRFDLQPFSAPNVAKSPIVLVGTFTGINNQGQVKVPREAFRICLVLVDLKSGKIVSKGTARAKTDGVNVTPTAFFKESPVWAADPVTEGYIKTCQGSKVGDSIDPVYWDRIIAASLVAEAIDAYDNGQYQESLDLYKSALQTPAGEQLRVYNGIYLTNWKLRHRNEAASAFGKVVDYGLANKRLAVKFLFKPGSVELSWPGPRADEPYHVWVRQISRRTATSPVCLEVVGHTSRTGPEPLNDRLSLLRAQYIKQQLESTAPQLNARTKAIGMGSRENIVGSATDDASDALDRRVEFKVVGC